MMGVDQRKMERNIWRDRSPGISQGGAFRIFDAVVVDARNDEEAYDHQSFDRLEEKSGVPASTIHLAVQRARQNPNSLFYEYMAEYHEVTDIEIELMPKQRPRQRIFQTNARPRRVDRQEENRARRL